MAVRLFVGNLPYNVTEAELREHFSSIGPLSYVSLPTDRETGKLRGFAFVELADPAQAEEAIRRLNNQLFKGRPLAINEARAREVRPRPGPAPSRSPSYRSDTTATAHTSDPPARGEESRRNFGPDIAPRRSRSKPKGGQKQERAPKGPMREVVRGQLFGGDDDDDSYDDELAGENFASRVTDAEGEDELR